MSVIPWSWTEIAATVAAGTIAVTAIATSLARAWLKLIGLHSEAIIAEIQAAAAISKASSERVINASNRATDASERAEMASSKLACAIASGDLLTTLREKVVVLERLAALTDLEHDKMMLAHAKKRLSEVESIVAHQIVAQSENNYACESKP